MAAFVCKYVQAQSETRRDIKIPGTGVKGIIAA